MGLFQPQALRGLGRGQPGGTHRLSFQLHFFPELLNFHFQFILFAQILYIDRRHFLAVRRGASYPLGGDAGTQRFAKEPPPLPTPPRGHDLLLSRAKLTRFSEVTTSSPINSLTHLPQSAPVQLATHTRDSWGLNQQHKLPKRIKPSSVTPTLPP